MVKRITILLVLIFISLILTLFLNILVLKILLGIILFLLVLFLINLTTIGHRVKKLDDSNQTLFDERAREVLNLSGNRKAILLIHGFSSNPWLFHKHIPLFEKAGYDVIAPRLPGHGISSEYFLKTDFKHYEAKVLETYEKYRNEYDHFHVIGISMGGLLTLNLTEELSINSDILNPTSITTLAAPVRMRDPRLLVLRMLSWVIPRFKDTWDPNQRESDGAECWLGYNDLFLPQAWSLSMAMVGIRERLNKIQVPHFMIHARGDKDVPFFNLWRIASSTSSKEQEIWTPDLSSWNHSHHSLFLYDSLIDPLNSRILAFLGRIERI